MLFSIIVARSAQVIDVHLHEERHLVDGRFQFSSENE
jgi:hypothetical protein